MHRGCEIEIMVYLREKKYVKKTPKAVKILQTIITLAILIKHQGLTFVRSP